MLDRTEPAARRLVWAVRWHIERLTHAEVELSRLREEVDGKVVRVRGRVRAETLLEGLLHGVPGVFRCLVFRLGGRRWMHEAAVEFDLVDARGEWARVQPRGARLLAHTEELMDYPMQAFGGERVTPSLSEVLRGRSHSGTVPANELVLRDGAEVEIVAHKARTVDPTGYGPSYREPPQRPTLRSEKQLPLLITPIAPAQ